MKLVVFNMSNYKDWESGIVNRNYFVVQELINRNLFDDIYLVDFLAIQPIKKIFGKRRTLKYWASTLKRRKSECERDGFLRICKIDEKISVVEGIGYVSSINQLKKIVDKDTVIWSYNPFLPEVFSWDSKIKVFDTVDNWATHASYTKKEKELLESNYEKIGEKADYIFTVSKSLVSLFPQGKATWVPNGVDLKRFENAEKLADLDKQKRPIIGYIGTIQDRFDFDLFDKVVSLNKDKTFVLAGPVWDEVQSKVSEMAHSHKNIKVIGRIPYKQSADVISSFDICIIPHKIDDFIKTTDPMKMYDYLALGKPVVTTPGAGTDVFKEYLYIAKSANDFSDCISKALNEDQNQVLKRKEIIKSHTYSKRVDEILKVIGV